MESTIASKALMGESLAKNDVDERLQRIGRLIAYRRVGLGLNQYEFAEMLGVRQGTVSAIEKGRGLSLSRLTQIADILKIEIIDLMFASAFYGDKGAAVQRFMGILYSKDVTCKEIILLSDVYSLRKSAGDR